MNNTLDSLSDHARVWIYQSNRAFTAAETTEIAMLTDRFASQWSAHGHRLAAGGTVAYQQFIILAVDEQAYGASGCSIDSSVAFIRQLEQQYGLQLLDRTQVAFLINEKVTLLPLNAIKEAVTGGTVSSSTLVFNNLVENIGQWKNEWLVPAGQTWLKRYFRTQVVAE